MRHLPLSLTLAVTGVILFGSVLATWASAQSSTLLPLGDNKYSTTKTQKGYIYLCNAHADNFGAFKDGPWIQGHQWDPSKKATVDGKVLWPKASVKITTSGNNRVIATNALPWHTTGTYPIAASDDAYQYDRNPNSIQSQSITITLPKNPTVASSPSCMGGEVGIALTGVPIFNGFDAGLRDAVAHEVQDDHNGHPQEHGEYHYHNIAAAVVKEIAAKTKSNDDPLLIGYAYDGFGIYASPTKTVTDADLDVCHGRTSSVMWNGKKVRMYHYEVTSEFPYTVGCFKGTPIKTGPTAGSNQRQQGSMPRNQQPGGQMTGPQGGPPPEAISACSGKSQGSSCQFSDSHGSHSGSCQNLPEGSTACVPGR